MIQVDISNVWGCIEFSDLMSIEKEVFESHNLLSQNKAASGWINLPDGVYSQEISRILETADFIRQNSDLVIVLGVGGAVQSSQAAIHMLSHITGGTKSPRILYAGNSFSSLQWDRLLSELSDKDFSVVWISRSGTTTETAVAARALRWLLERKYGTTKAKEHIYAITDPNIGFLRKMASDEGWASFLLPAGIKGRFSALTAAGLLPMSIAGIDIEDMLKGACQAASAFDLRSYENPAWLYAAARNLLYRHNRTVEVFSGFEPDFLSFGRWWQQLYAGSEGRDGKGIVPCFAEYSADLYTIGQLIQQGPRCIFETMLRFEKSGKKFQVENDIRVMDGLDYLVGKSWDELEESAYLGALEAHSASGVPVLTINCGDPDARTFGELFYFFELSCALSAMVSGVDPFGQSGTEQYRQNMFRLLGRPGYETSKNCV